MLSWMFLGIYILNMAKLMTVSMNMLEERIFFPKGWDALSPSVASEAVCLQIMIGDFLVDRRWRELSQEEVVCC